MARLSNADEEQYPPLASTIDVRSPVCVANRKQHEQSLQKLGEALTLSREGGNPASRERHVAKGKWLPRTRIEWLLDRDSHFLELCALAGHELDAHATGASIVGGIGRVSGVDCLIVANESTIKGGALSEYGVAKSRRLAEIAAENRLPTIHLAESAGADLPNQDKVFLPGGAVFRDITRRSAARIPTITIVFGSSTAGGAYVPGMSDYAIFVKDQATVYLGGPPLVKMATGEVVDDETLGGAEMHSRVSGVSDFLALDERDAIRLARSIVTSLNLKTASDTVPDDSRPPLLPAEELLDVVSADVRVPFDPRDVLARVVDESRFLEFKPLYGPTLVCGWASVMGFRVGVLANHGALLSESANKGAQFIQLCNSTNTPLLFLQNITGFMVGKSAEESGIIKHGAKLINAVSNSTVPAITLMTGASYGAGNYAMAGRAYAPRFLFTYPSHRIAVMGGQQLSGVMEHVTRASAIRKGEPIDEETIGQQKQMIEHHIEQQSSAFAATARVWDDGIIDPRDTRAVLGISLSIIHGTRIEGTSAWGVFRH